MDDTVTNLDNSQQSGLALSSSKGFTLIEVVLVLAIGGLIFLLAFLAFQQVSRNRRDMQRRSDLNQIVAEIENYRADTGSLPGNSWYSGNGMPCANPASSSDKFRYFMRTYVCQDVGGTLEFKAPDGSPYTITSNLAARDANVIVFKKNRTCENNAISPGKYRIQMGLESGFVCRDSL